MKYGRMYIRITNAQGDFCRVGDPFDVTGTKLHITGCDEPIVVAGFSGRTRAGEPPKPATPDTVTSQGILSYPSKSVAAFRIYVTSDEKPYDAATVWKYLEFKAIQSDKSNISYALVKGDFVDADFAKASTETTAQIDAHTKASNNDPNRVLISTPYKPRQLFGRNAYYVGNSADDEVLAFKANARAVSVGQFGQYPLYAFCKNSIWAMEVGEGDVAFNRVSPVSINEGIVNKHAAVNVDTMIVYATPKGIKTIPESEQPLSYDIQNSDHVNDLLKFMDNTPGILIRCSDRAARVMGINHKRHLRLLFYNAALVHDLR